MSLFKKEILDLLKLSFASIVVWLVVLLLIFVLWEGPTELTPFVAGGSLSLIILITLRQFIAIRENYFLSDHLLQKTQQLSRLQDWGLKLTGQLHPSEVHQVIVQAAQELVHADIAALPLINQKTATLTYVEATGAKGWVLKGQELSLNHAGLCGWVLEHETPLRVSDLLQDTRTVESLAVQLGVNTAMVVPLIRQGRIRGGISVYRAGLPFTEAEERLLTVFASQAAMMVENAELYQKTLRQLDLLQRLQRAAADVTRTLNQDLILDQVMEHLTLITGCEKVGILLYDLTDDLFKVVRSRGVSIEFAEKITLAPSDPFYAEMITTRRPVHIEDVEYFKEASYYRLLKSEGIRARTIVPLMMHEKIIGSLNLGYHQVTPRGAVDLQLLNTFANYASIAIEHSRLYRSLEQQLDDLKQAQEQLIQSEKMAAVGMMISGVAHELNNPLTSIIGFSELICDEPGLDSKLREDLEKIRQEAERAKKVVQNLLAFSQRQRFEQELVDLNDLVNWSVSLREHQLELNHIQVIKDLSPSLPKILADPHQIQQVILNLIINAEQAMVESHGKGCLKIRTRLSSTDPSSNQTDPGKKQYRRRQPSQWLEIQFTDDGPGIPRDFLPKIFQPFFTIRQDPKGTGLGLAVAHRITKDHGGEITVQSEIGQGSTFTVYLPVH
jgi:signal transduction histidine kinase